MTMACVLVDKNQNGGYLAHHGVKGQKWGVKHGPPYPLSRQPESERHKRVRGGNSQDDTTVKERLKKVADARVAVARQAKDTMDSYDRMADIEKAMRERNLAWDQVIAQYDNDPGSFVDDYEHEAKQSIDKAMKWLGLVYGTDADSKQRREAFVKKVQQHFGIGGYDEVMDDLYALYGDASKEPITFHAYSGGHSYSHAGAQYKFKPEPKQKKKKK